MIVKPDFEAFATWLVDTMIEDNRGVLVAITVAFDNHLRNLNENATMPDCMPPLPATTLEACAESWFGILGDNDLQGCDHEVGLCNCDLMPWRDLMRPGAGPGLGSDKEPAKPRLQDNGKPFTTSACFSPYAMDNNEQ